MSQHRSTTPPPPADPTLPPAAAAGPPRDEVAAAKARLLEATEKVEMADPRHKVNDFLRDHPYIAAGAALGAGLAVARVAMLRKIVVMGGMWAAKRYLTRYMHHLGR